MRGKDKLILKYRFCLADKLKLSEDKIDFKVPNELDCFCTIHGYDKGNEDNLFAYEIFCINIQNVDIANKLYDYILGFTYMYGYNAARKIIPYMNNSKTSVNSKYLKEITGKEIIAESNLLICDENKIPNELLLRAKLMKNYNEEEKILNDSFEKFNFIKSNNQLILALEIYNDSMRQTYIKYQFLSLVMILETLAENNDSSTQLIEFIDKTIEDLESSNLSNGEKDSTRSRLSDIKKISVRKSILILAEKHNIVPKYNDLSFKHFADLFYSIRSSLVHSGNQSVSNDDLKIITNELHRIVRIIIQETF